MVGVKSSAVWLIAVAWAATLQAQQPAPGYVPYQAAHRPDYVSEIGGGSVPFVLPPPPIDWSEFAEHARRTPDYLAELLPTAAPAPLNLPPPPVGSPPAVVHGIYLNAWVFGSSRFWDLLKLADSTEVNSFVIDVKDGTGYLTYRSNVPLAVEVGANGRIRAPDVRQRLAALQARGIHPVARIVVAKDPLLARHKPGWAIHDVNGGLWHDRQGNAWVDAYQDSVWMYAADLAREAVLLGFAEIQFDYLRFPDEPHWLLDRAVFPARHPGESQRDAVRRNVALMRRRTADLGVPFTLDVFGLTASAEGDLGIGQVWSDLAPLADVMLPMVYPSHYRRGSFGSPAVCDRAPRAGRRDPAERRGAPGARDSPLPAGLLDLPRALHGRGDPRADSRGGGAGYRRLGAVGRARCVPCGRTGAWRRRRGRGRWWWGPGRPGAQYPLTTAYLAATTPGSHATIRPAMALAAVVYGLARYNCPGPDRPGKLRLIAEMVTVVRS